MSKDFRLGSLVKVLHKTVPHRLQGRYGPVLEIYTVEGGTQIVRTNIDGGELLFHESDVEPISKLKLMPDDKK